MSTRSRSRRALWSLIPVALAACAAPSDEVEPELLGTVSSGLVAVPSFGTNPAQLKMSKFVPAAPPAGPRPLVVVLHGCTQTASAYESAGWSTLAEEWGFYVVYPEQNTARNNSSGCFNWSGRWKSAPNAVFTPEPLDLTEIARGNGENQSIKEMVDKMKADHPIDAERVFVTGLSAGGAMTALLLATWPDVFSAGAIFAGIPYGCATDKKTTKESADCLGDYSGANAYLARTPKAWGDLVRGAAPGHTGPYPRVQIWHGTTDFVVHSRNMTELVKQWTDVHGTDQTPDTKDTVESYPHQQFKDASGRIVVETFEITGKGHGTEIAASKPIDPAKAGGPKCGKPGSYILEAGICSTYHAAKFFGLDATSPGAGSSSGSTGPGADGGASGDGSGSAPGPGPDGSGSTGGKDDGKGGEDGSSSCTMTRPPASWTARTPRDPSLPPPDRTIATARGPQSCASERKKTSMGSVSSCCRSRSLRSRRPPEMIISFFGGIR